jgi:hypothetical protein
MTNVTRVSYLELTQESGRALFMRNISGSIVMLNLLRTAASFWVFQAFQKIK